MKKMLFMVMLTFGITSCTSTFEEEIVETRSVLNKYSPEVIEAINNIYAFCIEWQEIPANIINDKLETIRYCDLLDKSGDVLPELDGYEDIVHILWPNGYGVR